ncbi:10568_t:CDS:2, partial [Gigaspora margarita]
SSHPPPPKEEKFLGITKQDTPLRCYSMLQNRVTKSAAVHTPHFDGQADMMTQEQRARYNEMIQKVSAKELTNLAPALDPEVNQNVLNSSADQGPSNPNLSDLTSDNEIGEAAILRELNQEEEETNEEVKEETEDKTEEKTDSTNRPNISKVINLVKNTIYNTLFNYFDSPPDSVLLAKYAYIKDEESLNSSQESNNKNKLKEKTISFFKLHL